MINPAVAALRSQAPGRGMEHRCRRAQFFTSAATICVRSDWPGRAAWLCCTTLPQCLKELDEMKFGIRSYRCISSHDLRGPLHLPCAAT